MRQQRATSWFDHVLDDPTREYATPAAVLRDERLDAFGMRAILEAWEQDARRLVESADEGMAGGPARLRDVRAALKELERSEA